METGERCQLGPAGRIIYFQLYFGLISRIIQPKVVSCVSSSEAEAVPGKAMQRRNIDVKPAAADRIAPAQIAAYAEEMLESLKKMTDEPELALLSHLLELAALEARYRAAQRS